MKFQQISVVNMQLYMLSCTLQYKQIYCTLRFDPNALFISIGSSYFCRIHSQRVPRVPLAAQSATACNVAGFLLLLRPTHISTECVFKLQHDRIIKNYRIPARNCWASTERKSSNRVECLQSWTSFTDRQALHRPQCLGGRNRTLNINMFSLGCAFDVKVADHMQYLEYR